MASTSFGNAIRSNGDLAASVPVFEEALQATRDFRAGPSDLTILDIQRLRAGAAAYTEFPDAFMTLRLDETDSVYSYARDAEYLRKIQPPGSAHHGLFVAGNRLELNLTPPFKDNEILFSTLRRDPQNEGKLDITRSPRIYIGIGLAALTSRIRVWSRERNVADPYQIFPQA